MSAQSDTLHCDLLVIGSGASGLAAAVTAASHGLRVTVIEKAATIGGTTAWSGGWIWAPCNPLAKRAGIDEPTSAPRRYLAEALGNNFNAGLVDAFLHAAPRMAAFFEERTALQFEAGNAIPDTYGHLAGAGTGGRSLIAAPYDARELGAEVKRLRPPLRETTFLGMTIQAGPDLRAFLNVTRSPRAFAYVTVRMLRHLRDLALYRRGMQLRNGNALVGRLMRSALDRDVQILTEAPAQELLRDGPRVTGALVQHDGQPVRIEAARGVVLATGGFGHDKPRRDALFPAPQRHLPLAVPEATGDGLRLGESAGGQQADDLAAPGAWCPVSRVPFPDGSEGRFPHIIDRGKPGVIGVLRNGQRFCNEGLGYHDYVTALLQSCGDSEPVSWLICSHRFLRRYGLGIVRPAPVPYGYWLRSGYLKRGATIDGLARQCGIDAEGLTRTVEVWNAGAQNGEDPQFGRGTTPYMRLQGDPTVQPNPCVAPLDKGPFYAVQVEPGSFGTFAGLHTTPDAQVTGPDGAPVPGLYAVGTDMASVMGGHYPAGGINLGPAMTFGYIAGCHAAGVAP